MACDMEPTQFEGIAHDGRAHHPLGAGSYYFQSDLLEYIYKVSGPQSHPIKIFIGAQPNSSPHIGNMLNMCTAFALGAQLNGEKLTTQVVMDLVDTAPYSPATQRINGIVYQRSLRYSGKNDDDLSDFTSLVNELSNISNVCYQTRRQADIMREPAMRSLLKKAVEQREVLGPALEPRHKCLGIRSACPVDGCGLTDKHGVGNQYHGSLITFCCPIHGPHTVDLDEDDLHVVELNTPLRGLIRCQLFSSDENYHWVQVIGADYAGFYAEQMLWRPLQGSYAPTILYSPQILDWSGAKISKSLYVTDGAYDYLRRAGLSYLLSYRDYVEAGHRVSHIYHLALHWVQDPRCLFRNYTIHQVHLDLKRISLMTQ